MRESIRRRLVLGAAVTAALIVPLTVYGAPAISKSAVSAVQHQYKPTCGGYGPSHSQYGPSGKQYGPSGSQYGPSGRQYGPSWNQYGPSGSQYGPSCHQYKITVCHWTHSWKHPWVMINVNWQSVKAHLRHGDKMPPCIVVKHRHHGRHHRHGNNQNDNDNGSQNAATTTNSHGDKGWGHGNGGGKQH